MISKPMFSIKTDIFEGPLDLLLQLVEKRKLFISDISLSQVTDDYIQHVQSSDNFSIEDRANFIVIASTLLLVKSKSLLPTLDLTTEEQVDINDLETRLKLLQLYREISIEIKSKYGTKILFEKSESEKSEIIFAPHPSMTVTGLHDAIFSVIDSLPKKEKTPKLTIQKVKSLEETIEILTNRITSSLKMSFRDFSKNYVADSKDSKDIKVHMIVGFLAMLELVKQGIISVEQEIQYGDIDMQSSKVELPRYNV